MNEYDQFVELLRAAFTVRNELSVEYSLRAFSRSLGVPVSTLSSLMKGRRKPSPKIVKRIVESLQKDPSVDQVALAKFLPATKNSPKDPQISPIKACALNIKDDQFRMIASWEHHALLCLLETKDYVSDPIWLARRLGIPVKTLRDVIARLERLEFVRWDKGHKLKLVVKESSTTDGVSSEAILAAHRQGVKLAQAKLEKVPLEQRDFCFYSMAADPNRLPEARRMTRDFIKKLSGFLGGGDVTEVYRVAVNLFPLTKTAD